MTADVLIISTYSQLHLPISSLMDQNFFGRCSLPHFLNTCLLLKDHAWYALAILSKSLKKSTFKLEFFFYFSSKISSILSILQIWETYKLNFYDNMQTSNKIWSVFMILQEKSFYQKIYKKYGLDTSPRPLVLIKNQALITWSVCHITREKFLSKISAKKYGLETSPRPFVFIKNQRLHVLLRMEFLKQAHYIKSVIAQLPPYVSIKADFHWSLSERIL